MSVYTRIVPSLTWKKYSLKKRGVKRRSVESTVAVFMSICFGSRFC